jgi:hypothetical protein
MQAAPSELPAKQNISDNAYGPPLVPDQAKLRSIQKTLSTTVIKWLFFLNHPP